MLRAARAAWIHRALLTAIFLAAAPLPARAQSLPEYFIPSLASAGRTSGFPADWQRTNSLARLTITNNTDMTANIQARIYRGSSLVGSTPSLPTFYPAGSRVLDTPDILDWRTTQFMGDVGQSVERTGHLPDGMYQLCIDLSNIRNQQGGLVRPDTSVCVSFFTLFPKPPTLLFPRDGGVVSMTQPIFQWTPVVSELGRLLTYWFRLVEVMPGQTPLRAVEANRAIYETFIDTRLDAGNGIVGSGNVLPYPASAPLLLEGRRYAWRIQTLYPVATTFGRGNGLTNVAGPKAGFGSAASPPPQTVYPVGENEGRSQVYSFTWTADPRRSFASGDIGAVGAPDTRMGAAPEPREEAREAAVAPEETPRMSSAASGENFADRLARVMASLWKKGPGAAATAARVSGRQQWREAVDARLAQGPTEPGGATGTEGVAALPPAEAVGDSVSATVDPVPADAAPPVESAPVTTAAPSLEPPGIGPGWARLHGTASVSGETYSRSGNGEPTRPDRSARVVTGLSVGILKDRMRIPVSALISDDQVSFRQNINQIAVAPKWQWAGLTAGSFSPQYSPYTLADATILGGGLDLAPNKFRIGFLSGRARKAILPTLAAIVAPQFERNMTAGRIGYGEALANNVEFSVMRATDDEGSIAGAESTLTLTPEGNTVYSLKAQGVMPSRHLRAQIETALSKYDRDRRADAPTVDGQAIGLQLFHETGRSRMGVKAEWLNGGFMTLGNSGITGDRIDLGFNAGVQIFQGKLSLNGSAGLRNDAVGTALAAETRRRNWGLNGSWQPDHRFGADAQMSVYENTSDDSDTLAAFSGSSNVSRIYSVMPRANLMFRGVQNSFSVSATLQTSRSGGGPGTFLNTNSLSLLGSWSAVIARPWTLTFSGNYQKTDYDVAVLETSAFGPGFTWAAFRSRLLTTAQLQFTRSRTGNAGTDEEITPRGEMRWEFANRQALVLRGNYRRFHYANTTLPEFNERVATLEYVTNL